MQALAANLRLCMIMFLGFAVTSCSGGGGAGNSASEPLARLSGVVSAGPVSNATVSVHTLNPDSRIGALIATTTTDTDGSFILQMPPQSNPVILVAEAGSYKEEASGDTVDLGMAQLRAVLSSTRSNQEVGITPLSEIATQHALAAIETNGTASLSQIINASNSLVATGFGLSDITIPPANPNSQASSASSKQAAQYALVLAGISKMAQSAATATGATVNSLDVTQALGLSLMYNAEFSTTVGAIDITVPNSGTSPFKLSSAFNAAAGTSSANFAAAMSASCNSYASSEGAALGYNDPSAVPAINFSSAPAIGSSAASLNLPSTPLTLPTSRPTQHGPVALAPINLTYPTSTAVYTKDIPISANVPSNQGGSINQYTISPPLPSGLSIDPSTGIINGTPTTLSSQTSYVITGTNNSGSTATTINITVNDQAPANLNYLMSSPTFSGNFTGTENGTQAGTSFTQTVSVSIIQTGNSITGTYVTGSGTTGTISGTVSGSMVANLTVHEPPPCAGTYTGSMNLNGASITANISGISACGTLSASVSLDPILNTGAQINSLTPANNGGTIVSYAISPPLPSGLNFNSSTGVISGSPTGVVSTSTYTVTATNSGGSTTSAITFRTASPALTGIFVGAEVGTQNSATFQQQVTLFLIQNGSSVSGSYSTGSGTSGTVSGTISGSSLSVNIVEGAPCAGTYGGTLTVSNTLISGTISGSSASCGQVSATVGLNKAPKSVWSTWTAFTDTSTVVLNLNGGTFGVRSGFALKLLPSQAMCTCQFIATGNDRSGSYTFSSCTYTSGGSGDPGCSYFNTTGTYTNDGTTLKACDPTCGEYH